MAFVNLLTAYRTFQSNAMISIILIPWARQSDFRLKALDGKAGDELHFSRLSKLRISINPDRPKFLGCGAPFFWLLKGSISLGVGLLVGIEKGLMTSETAFHVFPPFFSVFWTLECVCVCIFNHVLAYLALFANSNNTAATKVATMLWASPNWEMEPHLPRTWPANSLYAHEHIFSFL